jgi:TetR/AcrR family transcriptional regulator
MATDSNTEQLIIDAAKKIFLQRGLAGARMQDIADEAGINKAMLHYYFRSKDKLFEIIFNEAIANVIGRVARILGQPMPIMEKLPLVVNNYITSISQTPYLPIFVLNEISQQPEMFIKRVHSVMDESMIHNFLREVVDAGKQGIIREVSPIHLLLNLLSLCVFPFAAKPLVQGVLQLDNVQYSIIMEERRKVVMDTLNAWLKP